MKGIFNPDNPVMALLTQLADLVIVNLLWFVCSIPIVTLGASTTALYYVCLKLAGREDVTAVKDFFASFKQNFKQATVIWLFFLVVFAFLGLDIYSVTTLSLYGSTSGTVLLGVFLLAAAVALPMFLFAFAVQARFDNAVKNTLKNAALLGIANPGHTVLMVAVDALLGVLCARYCPFLLPVLPVWFNSLLIKRIFTKVAPQDKTQEETR